MDELMSQRVMLAKRSVRVSQVFFYRRVDVLANLLNIRVESTESLHYERAECTESIRYRHAMRSGRVSSIHELNAQRESLPYACRAYGDSYFYRLLSVGEVMTQWLLVIEWETQVVFIHKLFSPIFYRNRLNNLL